ncbi:MAG: OmpA family protein [Bacteroidota bacterium]
MKNTYLSCLVLLLVMAMGSWAKELTAQVANIPLADVNFRKGGDVVKLEDNCYQLTPNKIWSSGAIWYPNPVNLNDNFEMEVDLFLGCDDNGADGIVFIFSPDLKVGYAGEGMGFAGLYPSLGIEFDTYQNFHLNDPAADHVAVLSDGSPNHRFDLAGPIALSTNLEDCKTHRLKVLWKAREKELLVNLDGQPVIGLQKNIVADIFYNNPKAYWGFTSATGGKRNQHKICFEKLVFNELPKDFAFARSVERKLLAGEIRPLDKIQFPSGKTTLTEQSEAELTKLLTLLKENPEHHLTIYGHTDNVGNAANNQQLSQKRAQSILKYLVKNGINPKRLIAKGVGEAYPIVSNKDAAGRLKNRRIEIHLYRPIP